jgi:hypothetical protein
VQWLRRQDRFLKRLLAQTDIERRMRTAVLAVIGFLLVACSAVSTALPPASNGGLETAQTVNGRTDFSCNWGLLSNGQELNVAYPDSNATYWVQALKLNAGDSIRIRGSFPGARYFSFTTYDPSGAPYSETSPMPLPWPPSRNPPSAPDLNSEINDAQLSALTGTNYFTSSVPPPLPPTGTYRLRVVSGPPSLTHPANAADPRSVAVLAAPTPGSTGGKLTGWLIYRVYASYVGHSGHPKGTPQYERFIRGGVPLPSLANLPACPSRAYEPVVEAISVPLIRSIIKLAATPAPEPLFEYNSGGGLFPNADNKYVYGTTTWAPGRLIIVTGIAPTFPNTNAQAIVQTPPTNVRYWSMCTNADVTPAPVVQCADDQNTHLFAPTPESLIPPATDELFPGTTGPRIAPPRGALQYAYVVSSDADKPAVLDPRITWLPWFSPHDQPPGPGSRIPGMLILRNMLPTSSFIHSVQNIPYYGQSAATQLLASLSPPQNPSLASNPIVQAVAVMGSYYPRAIYCQKRLFDDSYATHRHLGEAIAACVQAASRVEVPLISAF